MGLLFQKNNTSTRVNWLNNGVLTVDIKDVARHGHDRSKNKVKATKLIRGTNTVFYARN